MRVLGIDLGVNNTGFVLVDINGGMKVVYSEVYSPKSDVPENLFKEAKKKGRRGELKLLDYKIEYRYLVSLFEKTKSLIRKFKPDAVVVEKPDVRPIFPRRTQVVLFMLYSTVLLATSRSKVDFASFTKSTVNKVLGIKSSKSYKERKKEIIERYKNVEFDVKKGKLDHVADALAVIEAYIKSKD